ncbi:hypothetical protein PB1_03355 [Bacillus methanolicus PB1]|uniref:Uncharacterized protein n=1 Tax=Bacillus methanolicus PB1 TaxID=997296 RepID=I3E623_BACMT|nr:hypothetical protein PB1_03355 [Bacillus methanolicus PB1]
MLAMPEVNYISFNRSRRYVYFCEFQQKYRDYIDFVKMLQPVPGVGAVVGAFANYNLLDHLGEMAMNAYRLRLLKTPPAY